MAHEFIDLKGFLFLVLITIPQTLSTNIDCGGKPFHCLNTTHFMICVDLGGGVSSTIDDFIIPCPPTTVCEKNNRFECEFPKIEAFTTDLNVIGFFNGYDKSADDKTIPPDKRTTVLPLPEKTTVTELPTKDKSMSSFNSEILENLKDEFTGGNEKFFDEDIIPIFSVVSLKNKTDETSFVSPDIEKLITTTEIYPHTNANTSTNGVVSASRTDIPILKDNKNNTDETSFVSPDMDKLITTTDKYPHTNASTSTNGVVSRFQSDIPTLKDNKNNTDEISFVSPNKEKIIFTTDKYPHINANTLPNGVVSASQIDIPTLKDVENNTDETSFVSPNIEKLIITTHKYPHTNVNFSANGVVSVSRTDILTLKDNITYTAESKTRNNNNTGNKLNTTKKIVHLYVNELNQNIDKFIGLAELTTSLPNSSGSITRINNIDVDPDNSSSIYQSQNLDLQKKIFKTVPLSRNVSHLTTDTLSTSEKVMAISSKYNATDLVDNHIATNGLTLKPTTTATNYSVEPTTEKLRTDDAYSPTLQSVTANSIGITTTNMTSNTSGKDLPKLKETDTSSKGLIIVNELYNSNKHNTTNKIDQNNINELNRTSDKFIKKLNSTTSQHLFNVSGKLELQQKVHNPDFIPVTVSEMIMDTLSTTEAGLVTSLKYNSNDNVDNVIVSEVMVGNSLPVKANSTVTNNIVKSVSEVLKNDDEHKDVFKPVTASPAEKRTAYSSLSYDSGTTNSNIIFAEVTNINRTSYSSNKHETLQNVVTTKLSIKPVKQSVLQNLSTNDSNSTMQVSDGFTFKMKTPHTLANDDNKIGFKGDIEIKSKDNASILNDSKTKVGINKTKEDYLPTEGNIDQMINHNMKPTVFQRTLINNNQTSATESPITNIDEQLISSGDNYTHNLNSFVENKVQSVPLQESISNYTRTIEKPKKNASPLVNNLTTFGEISLGIEPTTTIDFILQQSNHMVTIHNVLIDLEVESSSSLPTITSININETNKATQNTIPVLQPEAVTYSDDNSNHQDTIIAKGSDISSATAEINKTLKTIESNDTIIKRLEIGTNSRVDSDEYQLPTPNNIVASEQVSNLSKLQNSVNLTLLTGHKDDITLVPLESVTANIEVHKENFTIFMATTTELDGTRRYPLITESVIESIYSTNMSAGTPSNNDIVVSTQTVKEYTKYESTLNDKEGNTTTSRSEIFGGLFNRTANSLFHPLRKTNESNRAPTALVTDVSQDIHLSLNNEGKIRNNITTATVIDIIESDTGFGGSKLLTSNATTKKPPLIRVNRILPSMTVGVIQHNTSVLDNVGRQIVNSDVTLSTPEAIAHELDSISTLPTPVVVTAKKQPNIVVNRILSSTMASFGQYNKDELVKDEKQIVNSNIANSTEQIVSNDLDSMSTVPTPNEATVEKQPSILVNRVLSSTMTSISQVKMDEFAKVETPIKSFNDLNSKSILPTPTVSTAKVEPNITVNRILLSTMASISQPSTDDLGKVETRSWSLNKTQSTSQKVVSDLDNISKLSAQTENMAKKESNITANRILLCTIASIGQPDLDESGKDKTRIESSDVTQSTRQIFVNDSDGTAILPSPHESTAKKEINIKVKLILLSNMAAITQPNIDDLGNLKTPIGNLNTSKSTPQTVANNLLTPSILLTPNESTAQKESNITVNGILPSTRTLISLLNTDELDKVQIQDESSNVTQTTRQTVDSNWYSTSILPTSKESISEKQHNITVNVIALNTLTPITQNNTDDVVKFETQIVRSKVTQNTQQIIGNDFDKTSFNTVTEPAAIVETINDTHNIVGRPILSDMIMSDVIFINETTNLKSPNQSNFGMPKKITEKTTVYEKLQKTTLLRNASNDLNKREDLNFEVVSGTFIDRQINIELSGSTHDNEKSVENYKSSPSTPINNKSVNTTAMGIGRPGYMSKNFSDLPQNITLLNKMKYIYNSTNNTEAKLKNLTGYNILSKQQTKQLNGSAVSQISNMNISYTPSNQMSNKSNLIPVIHLLASANAKNPPTTINAKKEKNTTFTVDCLKLPRGKYADSKDCRKFYICVGKLQPIVGTCPNNTVFSEINKQCTKNLSHCVRNNQFHCLYEGRFSDFLRDNIYFICVKNNLNGFLRYKLQCLNGYHLNRAIVKCEKNEIWDQSDTSVSNSSNVSNDRNRSVSNSDASESSGNGEFECKKEGKFPYPKNCRKYYVCTKNSKAEYRRKIKSCSSEEIYDKKKKKCVSSDSEES